MKNKTIRCAIYTRKSTEEGLDKEFNTLEAQREACEAYIKSQQHEGWVLIPTHYDDGGYTGGNMERPALKALMADIRSGRIDNVVVYKVDRLSRSLHDFAQMVTLFDSQNISFVSITQQFNTTTSMGRLTLNILLSFAQFEREVIGERVRDKVAASKQKGMWMGGYPPLGYRVDNRKLLVIPDEAALAKIIFERYVEMRSAPKLAIWLNAQGYTNKRWVNQNGIEIGGQKFTNQALSKILNNPVYMGRIRHKDKNYKGQHEEIISPELWHQVQATLKSGRVEVTPLKRAKHGTLLQGKCFSPAGDFYTPTYTVKKKVHYRYYMLKTDGRRIQAQQLETLVFDTIHMLAQETKHWHRCWEGKANRLPGELAQRRWESLWAHWPQMSTEAQQDIAWQILDRVVIGSDMFTICLDYKGIAAVVAELEQAEEGAKSACEGEHMPRVTAHADHLEINIAATVRIHRRKHMILDVYGRSVRGIKKPSRNTVLINALVKSYRWNQMLERKGSTISQIAREVRVRRTYVSRIVSLMYLDPNIISAILAGKQPPTLHLEDFWHNVPVEWDRQKELFRFAA